MEAEYPPSTYGREPGDGDDPAQPVPPSTVYPTDRSATVEEER
jgi:hypothetical protein